MNIKAALTGAALAILVAGPAWAAADEEKIALGRELAQENCARCHAIGDDDASRLPIAPPFRDLGKRYPVESLEEALAEGIVTGHEAMPQVEMDTDQIDAFITYLVSIQK